MRRAAIVAPVRTPNGVEGGALSGMPLEWLASTVLSAVIERSGIDPSRMRTISYGKERPVAVCNDISCWSQNRRAVTVLNASS